jgi:hypothetical protein
MSAERKQVLSMLAEGKIAVQEAERLLERLQQVADGPESRQIGRGETPSSAPAKPPVPGAKPKYLRVVVDGATGDRVNIRVPLALVRTGIKLSTMLPKEANEKLEERGIDLSQLTGLESEELIEALRELTVDVDSAKGDTVRVFCE